MRALGRIERVRKLIEEQELDAMVLRGNSDLVWLTGFEDVFDTEQAHVAILTPRDCMLHTDSRYATAMEEQARGEGIWQIDSSGKSEVDFVSRMLGELGLLSGRVAIDDAMPLGLYRRYVAAMPDVRFEERSADVLLLRAVKDRDEIAVMRRVQAIASQAFMETVATLQPGMSERDISLALEFSMRRLGADGLAFANIVASGPNGAKPHAVPGSRLLEEGDFVVFDFGARLGGYCSDTTRTVCIGSAGRKQVEAYEAVREANARVARSLKPGMTGAEAHRIAETALAEAGFGGRMGHALGHGVGIDIHELPLLSPRNEKPLVEGNVVTDEPGIYVPGEFGVRIEDCGVIGPDGFESFCELTHELLVIS